MAEFEENQRILADNAYHFPQHKGAARQGSALLQGLAYCAYCGRKMHVHYSQRRASYLCDFAHQRYGDPVCNRASTRHVDGLITQLFLQVVNTNALDVALNFEEQLQQEATQNELGWQPTRSAWPAALQATVQWYKTNDDWWRPLKEKTAKVTA